MYCTFQSGYTSSWVSVRTLSQNSVRKVYCIFVFFSKSCIFSRHHFIFCQSLNVLYISEWDTFSEFSTERTVYIYTFFFKVLYIFTSLLHILSVITKCTVHFRVGTLSQKSLLNVLYICIFYKVLYIASHYLIICQSSLNVMHISEWAHFLEVSVGTLSQKSLLNILYKIISECMYICIFLRYYTCVHL